MTSLGLPPAVSDALVALMGALLGWLAAWLRTRQLSRDQRETVSDCLALDRRVRRLEGVEGAQLRKQDRARDDDMLSEALEALRRKPGLGSDAPHRPGLLRRTE